MPNSLFRLSILEIPTVLRDTLAGGAESVQRVAAKMRSRDLRQIVVTGGGTSYHAALAACGHARMLAATNGPLVWTVPVGDFLASPPPLGPRDCVVAISASGETRDIQAAKHLAGDALYIGLTNEPNSTLARIADATLLTFAGEIRCLVHTKTFCASAFSLHRLWMELFGGDAARLGESPVLAEAMLANADAPARALARDLANTRDAYFFGGGAAWAVALEGALKFKEACGLHAEGSETREIDLGISTLVNENTVVAGIDPAGDSPLVAYTLSLCRELGAPVHRFDASLLPQPYPSEFAGILYAIPLYLACLYLAELRGTDVDHPAWTERYYQIART
ncbi:MAG: SIS domain-containing protein [Chloroflexi bacterium]|nr:SIS domain-containing protein [Chloroflexota bacterium]